MIPKPQSTFYYATTEIADAIHHLNQTMERLSFAPIEGIVLRDHEQLRDLKRLPNPHFLLHSTTTTAMTLNGTKIYVTPAKIRGPAFGEQTMMHCHIPYQTFSADGAWVVADTMQHHNTVSVGFRVCEVSKNLSVDAHQIAKRIAECMTEDARKSAQEIAKTTEQNILSERGAF